MCGRGGGGILCFVSNLVLKNQAEGLTVPSPNPVCLLRGILKGLTLQKFVFDDICMFDIYNCVFTNFLVE